MTSEQFKRKVAAIFQSETFYQKTLDIIADNIIQQSSKYSGDARTIAYYIRAYKYDKRFKDNVQNLITDIYNIIEQAPI